MKNVLEKLTRKVGIPELNMYGDSMTKTKTDKEKVDVLAGQFKVLFTEEPVGDLSSFEFVTRIHSDFRTRDTHQSI